MITIIVLGLVWNFALVLVFAGLFMACGQDCFDDWAAANETFFEETFALSVHTFTTVGFGSLYPSCNGGQVVVLVEEYAALISQLILGAFILIKVMIPRAQIRFATSVLISKCDGGWQLQIRIANQSRYSLEHGKAQLHVLFRDKDAKLTQLRAVLVADAKIHVPVGEPWTLRHIFDGASPIEVAMGADRDGDGLISDEELHQMLLGVFSIDVSLSFIDSLYDKKVRFLHRYYLRDVVTHATWDDMLRKEVISERADGSAERLRFVYDHDLLDSYTETSPPPPQTPSLQAPPKPEEESPPLSAYRYL